MRFIVNKFVELLRREVSSISTCVSEHVISCFPGLTGDKSNLLKVLNHIRCFENHFPYLCVYVLAFQQFLRVLEWMRRAEVDCKSVVTPVQRPLSFWRRKMVHTCVMVVGPPRRMAASHVADHLEMRFNESEVWMSLQDAVWLS